jgi:peptidoglycan hydrolase CwlO-like protein
LNIDNIAAIAACLALANQIQEAGFLKALTAFNFFSRRNNMTNVAKTGCQRLEQLIGLFEAEIKRLERSVDATNAELTKLQAAPRPDVEKIKVVQQKLTRLQAKLDDARQGLTETKQDFFENCPKKKPVEVPN